MHRHLPSCYQSCETRPYFPYGRTVKLYDTLKLKNTLVKSVYCFKKYSICSLIFIYILTTGHWEKNFKSSWNKHSKKTNFRAVDKKLLMTDFYLLKFNQIYSLLFTYKLLFTLMYKMFRLLLSYLKGYTHLQEYIRTYTITLDSVTHASQQIMADKVRH